MITQEETQSRLKELEKITDERNDKLYAWFRTLVTISVGLIGILISFKSDETTSSLKSIFFMITISTLGLGILCALVVLFSEVHVLNRTRKNRMGHLISQLDGQGGLVFDEIKPSLLYKIAYNLSFLFYFIALIGLITYGIVDEIKTLANTVYN